MPTCLFVVVMDRSQHLRRPALLCSIVVAIVPITCRYLVVVVVLLHMTKSITWRRPNCIRIWGFPCHYRLDHRRMPRCRAIEHKTDDYSIASLPRAETSLLQVDVVHESNVNCHGSGCQEHNVCTVQPL